MHPLRLVVWFPFSCPKLETHIRDHLGRDCFLEECGSHLHTIFLSFFISLDTSSWWCAFKMHFEGLEKHQIFVPKCFQWYLWMLRNYISSERFLERKCERGTNMLLRLCSFMLQLGQSNGNMNHKFTNFVLLCNKGSHWGEKKLSHYSLHLTLQRTIYGCHQFVLSECRNTSS